jgi:hypothetical protein
MLFPGIAALCSISTKIAEEPLKRVNSKHKLKEKLGTQPDKSSGQLISADYGGETSKLVLIIDGQDHTALMRELMSGFFTLLRNPLHHNLVDDDESKSLAMYSLSGLLLNYVDASKLRSQSED